MPNRITTVLDIEDKGFRGSLKSIGSAVGEADGFFGKFKAGATAGMDAVKANAGAFAAAGAAALVAFAVKAVGAFEDTAKAAIDLSKATGLSTEEASRWIGVGDDYKVAADQLTASIGKIGKTLDTGKWKQYGIATRDASGAARSANDILEDSLVRLSEVSNETERATIGNALFGKGYANLAPLVGHTRAEYDKMLGSVEKGQVITEAEAAKAEKMRLAQDKLKDALGEVTLAVGSFVAALSPLINILATVVGGTANVIDQISNMNTSALAGAGASDKFREAAEKVKDAHDKLAGTMVNAQTTTVGYSYAVQDAARAQAELDTATGNSQNSVEGYSYAAKDAADSTDRLKRETKMMADDSKRALDELIGKWDALKGTIDDRDALLNLQGTFDDVKAKATEAWDAAAKGAEDTEAKVRDANLATDDLKKSVIDYGKEVLGLPPEKVTEFLALIDQGQLDAVEAALNNLARNRTMNVDIQAKGGAGYSNLPHFDKGGTVPGPKGAPALIVAHGGEEVVPNGNGSNGGGPINVTIQMPVGSNGDDVVRAIEKWRRRNGNTKWMAPN